MTEVGRVTRRIVFYLPGFDPRGAMFYHHLYAAENAKQAAINGLEIGTGKRQTVEIIEQTFFPVAFSVHQSDGIFVPAPGFGAVALKQVGVAKIYRGSQVELI